VEFAAYKGEIIKGTLTSFTLFDAYRSIASRETIIDARN